MLYEKKMLILSGDGKGVVLMEKSARGVRFSLSTFDMPTCGVLKAGVITPSTVFVRDLPDRDNPSSVFILDIADISALHFAVFDSKLRLYGTNAKRMWESNIMDLLIKSDRREPPCDERAALGALPPISTPPEVLPMPDGSGIVQTRLTLYGDEALAESDFYTPLDLSARMPAVDAFLDSPRMLEGLAPLIEPRSETTAAIDSPADTDGAAENASTAAAQAPSEIAEDSRAEQTFEQTFEQQIDQATEQAEDRRSEQTAEQVAEQVEPLSDGIEESDVMQADDGKQGKIEDTTATVVETANAPVRDKPWQLEARLLKSGSQREIIRECAAVRQIKRAESVRPLRDTSFIERTRADIDKLFSEAEKDETLNSLMSDLVWIKVPTDGHTISVGRCGNELLCYAVAGTYRKTPPLGEQAQWLPANRSVPTGKGYWLIFQNLSTGEIIEN